MKEIKRNGKLQKSKTKCVNAQEIPTIIGKLSRLIWRALICKANNNLVKVTIFRNLCVKALTIQFSKIHISRTCSRASHSFPLTQIFFKNHHRHPSKTNSIQHRGWPTITSTSGKCTSVIFQTWVS